MEKREELKQVYDIFTAAWRIYKTYYPPNDLQDDDYAKIAGLGHDLADLKGMQLVELVGDASFDSGASTQKMFVIGGDEDSLISTGNAQDIIYAGLGNDTVHGGSGNDLIYGGAGDDIIDGGIGADTISGGLGNDILNGGSGADTFVWNSADLDNGTDIIKGFAYDEGDKVCIGLLADDGAVLNLHDLLEDSANNLDPYLSAIVNEHDITLKVKSSGAVEQTIVIEMGTSSFDHYTTFKAAYDNAGSEEAASMLRDFMLLMTC